MSTLSNTSFNRSEKIKALGEKIYSEINEVDLTHGEIIRLMSSLLKSLTSAIAAGQNK